MSSFCLYPLISLLASSLLIARCGGIIDGRAVFLKEYPYVASVTLEGEPVGAGVILSHSYVVSTCHLFADFDGNGHVISTLQESKIRVFAGTTYSNVMPDEDQQHRVPDLILLHPYCRFKEFFTVYDFAILRLQVPFYHSLTIDTFNLPDQAESILRAITLKMNSNGLCTVVGWGNQTVNYHGDYLNPSPILLKTEVKLIGWEECSFRLCRFPKRFCDQFVYESGAICTLPVMGSSNCVGDDGGALVCDDEVFGFASTPISCGELSGKPNLFARFDVAYDFLKSQSHS